MIDAKARALTADVVVVGGGIVGASTAFWLARAGLAPIIIERLDQPAGLTTAASAHSVRAQFAEPENIRMMLESLDIFERFPEVLDLAPEHADIGFVKGGYLFASTDPEAPGLVQTRVACQRSHGLVDVEALLSEEIQHRFPWLDRAVTAASFRAGDGWIDGVRATQLFIEASAAPVLYKTEVLGIERRSGRVTGVRTDKGTVATDTVVLAAGPFTACLAGESLPLELIRRHRLVVEAREEVPVQAPMTVDADTGAHWRPHRGGALLAWARPEASGPAACPVSPDPAFPAMVLRNRDGVSRLSPFWRDLAPRLRPGELHLAAGQYVVTPDHMPVIGPAAQEGLWLHTGYSGHGIMGSPSGGRLLADRIAGRLGAAEGPFRLDRFTSAGEPTNNERMAL
jgi:sarcosine oxidase subunit beta